MSSQGEALRLHFEAAIAAVELPVPRGKLKNRINASFLKNPLCRGVDELCTKQLESRCLLFAEVKVMKDALMKSNSDKLEYLTENFELKKENGRLEKENFRQDMLFENSRNETTGLMDISDQTESVLMHYNELQSRSAEVEAMAMNFEQGVADAVARAGLWAKPGPKKEAGIKGTIGRGKPNHSEWISGEISVENPTSDMATPPSRKKDKKR
jgi:hypothetical protein